MNCVLAAAENKGVANSTHSCFSPLHQNFGLRIYTKKCIIKNNVQPLFRRVHTPLFRLQYTLWLESLARPQLAWDTRPVEYGTTSENRIKSSPVACERAVETRYECEKCALKISLEII